MIKKNLRRCEIIAFAIGLPLALVLALVWLQTGRLYFSVLIGYYIGCLSFLLLVETYAALGNSTGWVNKLALVSSNLKLLAMAFLIFMLHRAGFCVIEIAAGVFVSQLAVLFSSLAVLYTERKNAEG